MSIVICGVAGENRLTGAKFPLEIIDLQAIKEIYLARIILLAIISHGLPSDTLIVKILLELPEIWIILY